MVADLNYRSPEGMLPKMWQADTGKMRDSTARQVKENPERLTTEADRAGVAPFCSSSGRQATVLWCWDFGRRTAAGHGNQKTP
ncbi:hypothetical protein ACOMHN_007971 [Nucella lapillus]